MKRIKLAVQAFKPANIARGLEAARTPVDLESLSPEQRAAYEQALAAAAQAQAAADERRILFGPTRSVKAVQDRAPVIAAERAARDAARAPYRAPGAAPVELSRLPTRGKSQLEDVLAHLNASGLSPDRIYGVYRVPDRISQAMTAHSEKGRPVEWDVVHAGPGGAPRPFVATSFNAREHWVARRVGEASVLDEDLALAFCLSAGIGPERCAGIARVGDFRSLKGGGEHSTNAVRTIVRGVTVVHAEEASGMYERMRAAAPLQLGPAQGVYVDVLNWTAIREVVQPKVTHPFLVPSPAPYLPSTPQELLCAYLEVVGVQPHDSYAAQATVDAARSLFGPHTNTGPKQPCADGKDRMRAHGGQLLVFAYRERPEYAAGRERWAAYQRDVLQARLERGTGARRPVASDDRYDDVPRGLRSALRTFEAVARLHPDNWFDNEEELPPHRYCWPPVR